MASAAAIKKLVLVPALITPSRAGRATPKETLRVLRSLARPLPRGPSG